MNKMLGFLAATSGELSNAPSMTMDGYDLNMIGQEFDWLDVVNAICGKIQGTKKPHGE